ncbi:binding-protein-dependent transport systems inner membrane component [Ancylobacter novellus DSM 506]|uniref:Binding-protein-dependent transport systems inner membrane component n=1 Tax=Ancylobacter novellus (strain ATCC 8093 / DSM 506 / JCM 20403 / CCM 1077 / IAM 12100 / NBRC 12443 / NCIMB 10456) TaxID=639283 RepID=D7AAU3_ANCN5|nr:ABC transporter permease [Ancylobacter novellus]ADH90960.1 binding-protein-dependent transport systems inner membrane component [Ancylobacter novellus DSM 506]
MNAGPFQRVMFAVYIVVFFLYLLGPLAVMGVSAFNTPQYPQVWPFEGFTLDWFGTLFADQDLMTGLQMSVWIGILVVAISVPIGLAGAIVMTQIQARARSAYYLVVVSPVLTPGIIIGISTVVFWRQFTGQTGTRFLYDGVILTVLGQASFISAYCMLIILARLQRFDRAQEEAALDLGATYPQVFRHILLPFLKPALASAAVLAFLSSFENYNTTTFSILSDKTLTTVLAGRVRQGSTPAISALAVMIVAATILGAIGYELYKRRADALAARRQRAAQIEEEAELSGTPAPAMG